MIIKFRIFVSKNLDKMVSFGGFLVVFCLFFKFIDFKGGDFFFAISLLIEAFIFLLGAFKIDTQKFYKEALDDENILKNTTKNTSFISIKNKQDEKQSNLSLFYSDVDSIERDLKKIKEKINILSRTKKNEEIQQMTPEQMFIALNKKVDELSYQIENINIKVFPQTQPKPQNDVLFGQKSITVQPKRKRGRPRKEVQINK